jgi:hypothetical protein
MVQKVVSDDYENNKQDYINKCVDRPSLLHGRWLRTDGREGLTCCEMCEVITNWADFRQDLRKRNSGKGKAYKIFLWRIQKVCLLKDIYGNNY